MSRTLEFHGWRFRIEPEETKAAYTASKRGGAEDCECAGCRNLVAQRAVEYPLELRKFLESVGVDPFKEAEVCEYSPLEDGRSLSRAGDIS